MHPAYATIIQVNNNPGSNAQYASAQTAQDNANTGDDTCISNLRSPRMATLEPDKKSNPWSQTGIF